MPFIETQFPANIAYGSHGGPVYSTDIVETFSGFEQRNINWSEARMRYNVAHGVKTPEQLAELIAFFRSCRGRAIGFRFKDWTDYQALGQQIGIGDGVATEFQLIKRYINGSTLVDRIIKKPINGSLKLYLNSILQSSNYSIDYTTGIVTFSLPPVAGTIISCDFEFDVPVRFDTDTLDASIDDFGTRSWTDIPLVEIRL